jgi:hypothetical protein
MPVFAVAALVAVLLTLTACGGPAQIVDYSPQRGAVDVSTATPIQITFDHDVDQVSVESRLHLVPEAPGVARWPSPRRVVYEHETLRVNTNYEVVLEAGYRDRAGNVYTLRHRWAFVTEGPPSLTGSAPADTEGGVDPAAYLSLTFSRAMELTSLKSALTIHPSVPFDARLDPGDPRRAIIAPAQLLAPSSTYQVQVDTTARDADGNQLDRARTVSFKTGQVRILHGWITFTTTSGVSPAGLWIVNESGFPRQLSDLGGVIGFTWSPSGDSLLIQRADKSWATLTPGVSPVPLSFKADWAGGLAAGSGYVYLDSKATLHRQTSDGRDEVIATDVAEATVAPNGLRVAFVRGKPDLNEIWGYEVGLKARYQLATDTGPISRVTWAPAGNRIAYLRADNDATKSLRVRNLSGAGATTTVATGTLAAPAWFPDSTHLVFAGTRDGSALHKAYVVNVVSQQASTTATAGLPADDTTDVTSPIPSPDGHQIAFLSDQQIWLMNADGTRPTELTKFDAESFPYFSGNLAWTRA